MVIISYTVPSLSQSATFRQVCVRAKRDYRFRHLSIDQSVCLSVRSYRNELGTLRNDVIIVILPAILNRHNNITFNYSAINMGERIGVYRVLVVKPDGKRPLGRPRRR
jgi:hypothetical protein